MRNNRRPIILLAVLLLVIMLIVQAFSYFGSFKKFNVTYKNVSDVKIYDYSNSLDGGEIKLVKENIESGESVRLREGYSYKLSYKGADGYESGEKNIDLSVGSIDINPNYSKEKLDRQLETELPFIQQKITSVYANINLYEIQKGKLFSFGEWYGTTLKYVGKDPFNSDTLRIVLKKEASGWVIKTDPPYISLSKHVYKDVPEDILRQVNAL